MISIQYFDPSDAIATKVEVGFIQDENAEPMQETFNSETDIRKYETVQTTIIKIIDRVDAKTVNLEERVSINTQRVSVVFNIHVHCFFMLLLALVL